MQDGGCLVHICKCNAGYINVTLGSLACMHYECVALVTPAMRLILLTSCACFLRLLPCRYRLTSPHLRRCGRVRAAGCTCASTWMSCLLMRSARGSTWPSRSSSWTVSAQGLVAAVLLQDKARRTQHNLSQTAQLSRLFVMTQISCRGLPILPHSLTSAPLTAAWHSICLRHQADAMQATELHASLMHC
jgi:hypothetical protein